jgi:hypothetical protein
VSRIRNCTKRRRYTRLEAQIELARIDRKSKRNSHQAQLLNEAHIYRCRTCRGWHVTFTPATELSVT